jgi:hypothetical protein
MKKFQYKKRADKIPILLKGLGILMCIAMAVVLTNCDENFFEAASDDDSYEARLEKGIMALDDEDYDKAIDIFEKLREDYPGKVEICEYLANAYAGFIGVDTFNLLETIDELEDNDDAGNIEMVGRVLGGPSGDLTALEVDAKRAYLIMAIEAFMECIPVRDDDQKVQLGLMAIFDAAMIIAEIILDDFETANLALSEIILTEDGLRSIYQTLAPDFSDVPSLATYLAELNLRLALVKESVTALDAMSEGNDLSEGFDEFLTDFGYDDENVTGDDLEDYIEGLLAE